MDGKAEKSLSPQSPAKAERSTSPRRTVIYRSRREMKRAFRDGKGIYEDGQSSYSVNCQNARSRGRRPLSEAVRIVRRVLAAEGIKATISQARDSLRLTHDGEWHHTSKFGNRTNYYDPAPALELLRYHFSSAQGRTPIRSTLCPVAQASPEP